MMKPAVLTLSILALAGVSAVPFGALPANGPAKQRDAVVLFVSGRLFCEDVLEQVRIELLRAGHDVLIAAPDTLIAVGMDRTIIRPDLRLADADPAAARALVLVGGSGAIRHWTDSSLHRVCRSFVEAGRPVGSVGLANICLARAGLLEGRRATTFPDRGAIAELHRAGSRYRPRAVVVDGPVITGLDTKAAREFGRALVGLLERTGR